MQEIRARIGLIIPSSNQLSEPQFQRYDPPDVQVHVTRMRMTGPHHAPLTELMPRIIESAHCLADAKCDVIVFHCTAASMAPDAAAGPSVDELIREATGCQATTTADAVLAAFHALGVRKVVMHSPYNQATHDEEAAFLEQEGIQVLGGRALSLRPPVTTADRWLDITLEGANPEADAYFLSCTNIHSLSVLDEIEQRLHRPAIASNQATLWHCLRLCGIDAPVPGLGRLLSAAEPVSTHS